MIFWLGPAGVLLCFIILATSSFHGIISMTRKTATVWAPFHAIFTNSDLFTRHNVVIDTSPHCQGSMSLKQHIVLGNTQLSSSKMHLRTFIGKNYLSFP